LNVHNVSDIRQIEIYTAEPLVPGPSHREVEVTIVKLKKYKSPGSDQIPAELIQVGSETLVSEIHKLINSIWNKEELPDQWKESVIVPVHKRGDKTDCNTYCGVSLLSIVCLQYKGHRVFFVSFCDLHVASQICICMNA
jgi:hypothetical protein